MKPLQKSCGGGSEFHNSSVTLYSTCFWHMSLPIALLPSLIFFCPCRGSPNIEMDEHTFLVNRERAVDYLNSLDKVLQLLIFLLK